MWRSLGHVVVKYEFGWILHCKINNVNASQSEVHVDNIQQFIWYLMENEICKSFSQWCWWILESAGMLHFVTGQFLMWSILLPSSVWARVLDPGYTGTLNLCNVRAAYWMTQCNTATTGALCSCELTQLNVTTAVLWTLPWHWGLNSNYCPGKRNFKFKVP